MNFGIRVESLESAKVLIKGSIELCIALSLDKNLADEVDFVIDDLAIVNPDWKTELRAYGKEIIKIVKQENGNKHIGGNRDQAAKKQDQQKGKF